MATLASDGCISLPEGRRIGYAEYGAPHGRPVLFFHGTPGSRRQVFTVMAEAAAELGIRLVAPERPGYGLSDRRPGCRLVDWAADVAALADALGIGRFSVTGFSMGGVYALACAHALPARIASVATCGGLAPLDATGVMQGMAPQVSGVYALARADIAGLRNALASTARSAGALLAAVTEAMPECDQRMANRLADGFMADYAEALRNGIEGTVTDFILAAQPWGFDLAEIQAKVHLWQGDLDINVPPAMAEHLAATLPNATLHHLPGEGHFACFGRWEDILASLPG